MDVVFLAIPHVFSRSKDFVHQDPLGVMPVVAAERFDGFFQRSAFIERIPAKFFDSGVSVYEARLDLGAKLNIRCLLATQDGTHPMLAKAHNAG